MKYAIAFHIDSVEFTPGILSGKESLGGSESACVGLARALSDLGHDVHIFSTKISEDAEGPDHAGVLWHHASMHEDINAFLEWDVFVGLRMVHCFAKPIRAKLRVLWNQDLLIDGTMKLALMSYAWAWDKVVYVSEFHRRQWEELLPELKPLGYVTRNGFDPALVPVDVPKDPFRIIHISRPERGLKPLLEMWPALKARVPQATLHVCRYSSMYDSRGWGEICAKFDRALGQVQEEVGGIVHLGELGKASLYHAIAASAVMWYPGVSDFAETSCIAAIESQANGTPFVGSYKGALPETVPSGILVKGDTKSTEYQEQSVGAVAELLRDCQRQAFRYRHLQKAGEAHVARYTYAAIAAEWEEWLGATFRERYEANKIGVLRQLLHYDDHTAAKLVAEAIVAEEMAVPNPPKSMDWHEATDALALCDRVIAGQEQGPEDYAERAADPIKEAEQSDRFKTIVELFDSATHVLDVACGPGAFALALAKRWPHIRVTGVDYSAGNIETARKAAIAWGVADRCTFYEGPAYDFDTRTPYKLTSAPINIPDVPYDGAFIGEFLEHCANAPALVDAVERHLQPGSRIVFTVPSGPLGELIPRNIPHRRGHVHHFGHADLAAMFGKKQDVAITFMKWPGISPRGKPCGNWLISYRTSGVPTGARPYADLIGTIRPKARLSAGIIAKDAEFDLGRCLNSVWGQVDEIIVGVCGGKDDTRTIAETFDAGYGNPKVRILDLPHVQEFEDGFAGARNAVLEASTGDWFLWLDTDETLLNGWDLHKYLESGPFRGYSLRQTHLMLDAPPNWDTPVRLFKREPSIRFYGCVHEQPQDGDSNTDIMPALEITDVLIPHTGYMTEGIRRDKMLTRNRALLVRDQQRFPDRRLGKVLWIREYINMADMDREEHGGRITDHAKACFQQAIAVFEKYFADPTDKYHALARPFYERALQVVAGTVQIEVAIAGKEGGLGRDEHAKPSRIWVRSIEDFKRIMAHRMAEIEAQMTPKPLRVDPFDDEVTPEPAQVAV